MFTKVLFDEGLLSELIPFLTEPFVLDATCKTILFAMSHVGYYRVVYRPRAIQTLRRRVKNVKKQACVILRLGFEAEFTITEALTNDLNEFHAVDIDLYECKFDANILRRFSNITGFRGMIKKNQKLDTISVLSELVQLNTVRIYNNPLIDLSFAANLRNLKDLFVARNPISDLSPLVELVRLEYLDITETFVRDIGPVGALPKLRLLHMSNTKVKDISPLSQASSLIELDISGLPIEECAVFEFLTSLESLCAKRCHGISDFSPLRFLSNLKILLISGQHFSDLDPLERLTHLTWLSVSSNPLVRTLGNLTSAMTQLRRLQFERTSVTDLAPLAEIKSLQSIFARESLVRDVTPLGCLSELRTVDLSGTFIECISPLAQAPALQYITLYGTNVHDLVAFHSIRPDIHIRK